jgi:hypothetical protein
MSGSSSPPFPRRWSAPASKAGILYFHTVHAAVQLLYRDGVRIAPRLPPLVGQLITGEHRRVPQLTLWPLEWVECDCRDLEPLAVLWHPAIVVVRHGQMTLRGLEGVSNGSARRWAAQKWLCDVLDAQRARDYLKPRLLAGALPSSMPPCPPPIDPDRPFE